MGVLIEEITETVSSLPMAERVILADRLFDSIDSTTETEKISRAWAKEALRRLDEIESGAEEAIDAEEVFAELGILASK